MTATEAAIASLSRHAVVCARMSSPITVADYVIHATECLALGRPDMAAVMAGRGLDVYARRAPRRNAALWLAALREIADVTGAVRLPSVTVLSA